MLIHVQEPIERAFGELKLGRPREHGLVKCHQLCLNLLSSALGVVKVIVYADELPVGISAEVIHSKAKN